jgi:hypothetical protein
VCVNAATGDKRTWGLVNGQEYVVRSVVYDSCEDGEFAGEPREALLLQGIVNPHHHTGAFCAARFRLVNTLASDVQLFSHLLTNLPIYELAAEEAGSNVDRVDGLLLALNRAWTLYGREEE